MNSTFSFYHQSLFVFKLWMLPVSSCARTRTAAAELACVSCGQMAQKFTENRAVNGVSPKSSTLIGCSIINHPAIGVPLWLWKASDVQESLFSRVTFNASAVNWSCSRRFTWQRFGTIYIKHPTELWKHKRLQLTGTACLSPGKF